MRLKQQLKRLVFGLLGKDPEAVIVTFGTGGKVAVEEMAREFGQLVPERRHYFVKLRDGQAAAAGQTTITLEPGSAWALCFQLRLAFRHLRIGQAAVLFDGSPVHRPLRLAAFLLAPLRILAYNANLERHHLRMATPISSWLFFRGVPLDRIHLRPKWLCPWKKDRSSYPSACQVFEGRPMDDSRPRVAVLSPYFPYPLSHGGAVRIFNLLREASRSFDIFLFAFTESGQPLEPDPVLECCTRVVLVPKPRYREPRWSTLLPPEVHEYDSPAMRRKLAEMRREYSIALMQTEYTQLARYGGDILVEHDVTYDLYRQIHTRSRSLSSWWDYSRWRRFENSALRRFRSVVTMSGKDAAMLAIAHARAIPNGVDLDRYRPETERTQRRLLFIGSFRHFPNVVAYRFFTEEVWPALRSEFPDLAVTVVAGPDSAEYWRAATGLNWQAPDERITLLGFVRDVRPLYQEATLAIVPTLVSAGTNVKVLEAMAMARAVVSTSSGCAGLGLKHGTNVWIADDAAGFAEGVRRLLTDEPLRRSISAAARRHAQEHFSWKTLGMQQRKLWSELLGLVVEVREAVPEDLPFIDAIQRACPEASVWKPQDYLAHGCLVAERGGRLAGFIVFRQTGPGEAELLNVAVDPSARRQGLGSMLVEKALTHCGGEMFLEVRASNIAACNLYKTLGFSQVGLRRDYYRNPAEDGIVMCRHSC
jgi:ribosomal-protein-alanine acetyltransferase